MGNLTKNFSRSEFACKGEGCCGHSAPVLLELVTALQELRDRVGRPIRITSGFRCRVHNKAVGGAQESLHATGAAADLACPFGWTPDMLAAEAERVPAFRDGGIGIYSAWVHVDVRTTGKARWRK